MQLYGAQTDCQVRWMESYLRPIPIVDSHDVLLTQMQNKTKWPITPTAITIILLSSDSSIAAIKNVHHLDGQRRQTDTNQIAHSSCTTLPIVTTYSLNGPPLVRSNQINLHSRKVINQTHQTQIDRPTKKEPLKHHHRPWMHFCSCCYSVPTPTYSCPWLADRERENMECGNLIIASYFIIATRVLSCLHIGRSLSAPTKLLSLFTQKLYVHILS